jgi:methionyl-tRNA formyltransferase
MRIVYFGLDEFAAPTLLKLISSDHEIVAVVTRSEEVSRDDILSQTLARIQTEKPGLEVLLCENINTPELIKKMKDLKADLGIVVAFKQEPTESLRSAFEGGCIGIHPSLLPKYRGPSPIAWALLKGEKKTGVTVFRIADQPYSGPVLVQRETMIRPDEIWFELHYRLARVACDAIDVALKTLNEDLHYAGVPQNEAQATWAPELTENDCFLSFDESAETIATKCRATWPVPGVLLRYVNMNGEIETLKIVRARAGSGNFQVRPGTVTPEFKIATTNGDLEIQQVELSDRRVMSWPDFVKQRQVSAGDRFEPIGR